MKNVLYSAVQTEVITLTEAKMAIKIDSTDYEDNTIITSSVAGGYHSITSSATGTSVSATGTNNLVVISPVAVSAGGTLDVKIQESLDNTTFTDVSGGSFAQITTSNATTKQEKAYTGNYPYVRPVYTVAGAQSDFSIDFVQGEPTSIEDSFIETLISSAREYAEETLTRAIGEQKWKLLLDDFPSEDYIELPFSPVTEVDSVTYINSTGVSATMSASESNGYIVDTDSSPGKIFLSYGGQWPVFSAYPYNSVEIIYSCGYTNNVPEKIKNAILKMIGALYKYRDTGIPGEDLQAIDNLLRGKKIYNFY
jgi:uncharacterized phiE125 gp8 family phage protein